MQFHREWTLDQAIAIVPYLAELGISHLYASPLLTARAGSMHGYDNIDPGSINPELGGEAALQRLVTTLRDHGLGLILDIVPNHMAVGGDDNRWWLDVLEWGRHSPYADFFDIDWKPADPLLENRLLAPFLGGPYGDVLKGGDLRLQFDAGRGQLYAGYYSHRFPLAPYHYVEVLSQAGAGEPLHSLLSRIEAAIPASEKAVAAKPGIHQSFDVLKRELADAAQDTQVAGAIAQALAAYAPGDDETRHRFHQLLERQHYRLAWWRTAADEINWRRFFDITSLAGLRQDQPAVFEATHAKIFQLYAQGLIDGVRIDHVDGLGDPKGYCRKLRARLDQLTERRPANVNQQPPYIIVEKILAPGELLRHDWGVDGTTGYVFMGEVGALLHSPEGGARLDALWQRVAGRSSDFELEEKRARRRIPQDLFAAELGMVAGLLHAIARRDTGTRDYSRNMLQRGLLEMLVQFPVYRTYADHKGRTAEDQAIIDQVLAKARLSALPADRPVFDLLDRWLGGEAPRNYPPPQRRERARAIAKFQQLTAPVAAKSVEDTAFYRYGQLLSRNEVGANPVQFSMSVAEFHEACAQRLRRFPCTMLATATHDHKRGPDLRCRLSVLSELTPEWAEAAWSWFELNALLRQAEPQAPDAADEYMLYQTLVGAWPLELRADDARGLREYAERIAAWQLKALREGKQQSGWIEPNLAYEEGCRNFLMAALDPGTSPLFLQSLEAFVRRIAPAAAVNGLTQTLLRCTTPGVPDLYQGSEFWDLTLVDPDNRRPVDYPARIAALKSPQKLPELLSHWQDGHIKQHLLAATLQYRKRFPDLFDRGNYMPLTVRGLLGGKLIAFARRLHGKTAIVIASRTVAGLLGGDLPLVSPSAWKDTRVVLPRSLRGQLLHDVLNHGEPQPAAGELRVAEALAELPVALLGTA